ncbi:MAG: orotidine-5'-phosphate decarboxylase [Pseudomonadota bacterium]
MTDDRLIIALDVPTTDDARGLVSALGESGSFYKIGYQLMPIGGLDLAEELTAAGKKVFLDFKFHDIGATVEKGVRSVCSLGGDFLTVHARADVVRHAVAGRGDNPRLKILAVTVLTSLDQAAIEAEGISMPLEDLVLRRAETAAREGADGVVASAKEAEAIRAQFGNALKIVTPGVRPSFSAQDDQKRIVTPAEALAAGADHLVIGRPITAAENPKDAAAKILTEMAEFTSG